MKRFNRKQTFIHLEENSLIKNILFELELEMFLF